MFGPQESLKSKDEIHACPKNRVWVARLGGQYGIFALEALEEGEVLMRIEGIGPQTFCADGIYLGGPRVHRGAVTLARVRLGKNSFFGNRVVVSGGQPLPDDVLLGICTVSDAASIRAGTSWFGHPTFELLRREVVRCDRRFTHEPSLIRYLNRVFWELLRFALPLPTVLLFFCWYELLARAAATLSWPLFFLMALPLVSLAMIALSCLTIVAVKWVLLGRVRPGMHPLWSCWASRWDFVCMAWGFYAEDAVAALEGTLFLSVLLRAMGVRVGRNVVLGGGFAYDLVDPDMLSFEDGATVDCNFQTHTFEDRVLKIDRVKIRSGASVGRNATLLYGADIGAETCVSPHSVVMKYERLLPGRSYVGFPTRPSISPLGPTRVSPRSAVEVEPGRRPMGELEPQQPRESNACAR